MTSPPQGHEGSHTKIYRLTPINGIDFGEVFYETSICVGTVGSALPTLALADSITDFEGFGTSAAGTATITGTVTSGQSRTLRPH